MCAALARRHEVASAQEVTSWPHDADHSPELSIGRVVDALKDEFPAISLSKVRYLESEGLVSPARTGSGYRKYSAADVERLRYVLTEQRDSFTPLSVIRGQLDALDAGHEPVRHAPHPQKILHLCVRQREWKQFGILLLEQVVGALVPQIHFETLQFRSKIGTHSMWEPIRVNKRQK